MSTPRRSRVLWAAAFVAALVLVFAFSSSAFAADLVVGSAPCSFGTPGPATIQAAINAAAPNDVIKVCNGTYAGPWIIDKHLTIQGESRANTILDVSTYDNWGLQANDVNLVLKSFTFKGPAVNNSNSRGIKIAGDNATLTIEDVTVQGSYRTQIDLNGLNSVVLKNVAATGATAGTGIGLSNVTNVVLENITTSGNAWGGIRIGTGPDYTRGTSNVELKGTNSFGESVPVYLELEASAPGAPVNNIKLAGLGYVVSNSAISNQLYLVRDLAAAQALAAALQTAAGGVSSYIQANGAVSFSGAGSSLQAQIDATPAGGTVFVGPGTYAGPLVINKELALIGTSEAGVQINATAAPTYGIYVTANATLKNFTLTGPTNASGYGLKISGDALTATVENVTVKNSKRSNFDFNGLNGLTLTNVTAQGAVGGAGIALTDVSNATLTDVETSGNAWGGVALMTFGRYATGGSSGITFAGTNSFGEPAPVYVELGNYTTPAAPYAVKNVTIGMTHMVQNAAVKPNHFFLQPSPTAAQTFANAFTPGTPVITALPAAPFSFGLGGGGLQDLLNGGGTIVLGVGVFDTNPTFNINVPVQLIGAGSGPDPLTNTILRETAGAFAVVSINASGASAANPLLLKDLRIEPKDQMGITFHNETASGPFAQVSNANIKLDNVHVVGSASTAAGEQEFCMYVGVNVSVAGLTVANSAFDKCDVGWYVQQLVTPPTCGTSTFSDVQVSDTRFNGSVAKGIYAEKLSNATFSNVLVANNGWSPTGGANPPFNAGLDINLKSGAYSNITLNNLAVVGNGLGFKEGMGLSIKARSDGATYSVCPATLSGVAVNGGTFAGNERGIRIGEPGKDNPGPTGVVISGASIFNNAKVYSGSDGSPYGGLVNATTATVAANGNWWGAADGPSGAGYTGAGDAIAQSGAAPGAVTAAPFLAAPAGPPAVALYIPGAKVKLSSGATSMTLPVIFNNAYGPFPREYKSTAFAVDYDQSCVSVASGGLTNVASWPDKYLTVDSSDTDGEVDVAFMAQNVAAPPTLPNGKLLDVTYDFGSCNTDRVVPILFSAASPEVSCGLPNGAGEDCLAVSAYVQVDFNAAPTSVTLSTTSLNENVAYAGTVAATDPDADALTYAFSTACSGNNGANNGLFTLNGTTGALTASAFNFEAMPANPLKVCIAVTDGRGGSAAQGFEVTVTDVNEPPTAMALSNTQVPANAPSGYVVGVFSVSGDPDATFLGPYTYSFVGSPGPFSISGDQLLVSGALAPGSYTITVQVQDNGGPTFPQTFTINVAGAPSLAIADNYVVKKGSTINVPVTYQPNGLTTSGLGFQLKYNTTCLDFDTATPGPSSETGGAVSTVTVNVAGALPSAMSDVTVLKFNAKTAPGCSGNRTDVVLDLLSASVTHGANSLSLALDDGRVIVVPGMRADCNSDEKVNAGDFVAIILEMFDEDDTDTPLVGYLEAPFSTFNGSPVGCDANANGAVLIADVLCTVNVVFGDSTCTTSGGVFPASVAAAAVLSAPGGLVASPGTAVEVPITLDPQDNHVAAVAFTLKLDPAVAFDTTDADQDGLYDSIQFNVPASLLRMALYKPESHSVQVAIASVNLPMPELSGEVVTFSLTGVAAGATSVEFLDASAGNADGQDVVVITRVGDDDGLSKIFLPAITR